MCRHWHSRILHKFYFNVPGGSVSLGSDVSFHSTLHAGCLAPLKIGQLPQISRNSMRGSWEAICTEMLGEHCVSLDIASQKEQVSSYHTFASEIQANTPAVVDAGSWHMWHPSGDSQQSLALEGPRWVEDSLTGTRQEGAIQVTGSWGADRPSSCFLSYSWPDLGPVIRCQEGYPSWSHDYEEYSCWTFDIVCEVQSYNHGNKRNRHSSRSLCPMTESYCLQYITNTVLLWDEDNCIPLYLCNKASLC